MRIVIMVSPPALKAVKKLGVIVVPCVFPFFSPVHFRVFIKHLYGDTHCQGYICATHMRAYVHARANLTVQRRDIDRQVLVVYISAF